MGQAFSDSTSIFANEEDRKHGKSPQVEVVHSSTNVEFKRQDSTFKEHFRSDTVPRDHEANRKHGKSPQVDVVHSTTQVEFSRQDSTFKVVDRFRNDTTPREYEANRKHGKSPQAEVVHSASKVEFSRQHSTFEVFRSDTTQREYEANRKHVRSPQLEVVHCAKKIELTRQLESISEVLERFRSDMAPREYEANRKHVRSPQVEAVHCAKKIEFLRQLESISEGLERFISDTTRRQYEAELCKSVLKAEKPERWIKHYSSSHKILLVGEGDFSFSACLARAFVSADNMHATSLDSKGFLKKNYMNSMSNINALESRGCTVMHGVDVAVMAEHYMLKGLKFDRIVFNFPLAGFFLNESRKSQISRNQKLVSSFFNNAKRMISENGEIHVTHKSMGFFLQWNLESLAMLCSLSLKEEVPFDQKDYPGYENKYGFGGNKNFDYNPSKTYKFVFQNQSNQLRGLYVYN